MIKLDRNIGLNPGNEAPIAIIVFNRPNETTLLFQELSKQKPKKLFIIADGPRPNRRGEADLCAQVRSIAMNINWDCEVNTNFSDVNLGCKKRVISGLDWVFDQVDKAIVLEDDCVPSQSFFKFANELLDLHKNSNDVGIISGTSFGHYSESDHDYYFSKFPQIWGWATWKRVWETYDGEIEDWPKLRRSNFLKERVTNSRGERRWRRGFDGVFKNEIDTWDYQLVFALWKQGMKTIVPTKNLISNIGFGLNATHTFNSQSEVSNLKRHELAGEIRHPTSQETNEEFDRNTERALYEETALDALKGYILKILKKLGVQRKALQIYSNLVSRKKFNETS